MSLSIWSNQNPLDAVVLSHDHIAALVLKHEQQIKDLSAHLLELKQSITPMMEFKRREWVGLTDDEKAYSSTNYLGKRAEAWRDQQAADEVGWHGGVEWAEAKLKEKNGG
jgi:hypothetical protein